MKILQIKQNTQEWDELRRTHIGASNCAAILGKSKYKTPQDVWEEMVYGKKQTLNDSMLHGVETEEEARAFLSALHDTKYESAVGQSEEYPWMIASFDCYDWKNIAEIKCPGEKVFSKIEEKDIPEDYLWQMQHHLCVSGLEGEYFLAYMNPHRHVLHWIERDEEMIKELINGVKRFYEENILEFNPPEPVRTDVPFVGASEAWKSANQALKMAQEREKVARDALIALANGNNCRGTLVAIAKREREGNIDYSRIPELQEIDLEQYRKPKISWWEVRAT